MNSEMKHLQCASLIFATLLVASPIASADAVCDWNTRVGEIVVSARMGPPPANRAMAIANTAVYEAVNAITKRYPAGALKLDAAPGASVDAAIAAANRTALAKLLPSQQAAIDGALSSGIVENSEWCGQELRASPWASRLLRRSLHCAPRTALVRGKHTDPKPRPVSMCPQ